MNSESESFNKILMFQNFSIIQTIFIALCAFYEAFGLFLEFSEKKRDLVSSFRPFN